MTDLMSLFDAKEVEQLAKTTAAVSIDFGISPNPTKGNLTLTYSENQDLPSALTVTDQNGRQVSTLQLNTSTTQQIYLGNLPAGLYWVQLRTGKGKIGVKQVQVVK